MQSALVAHGAHMFVVVLQVLCCGTSQSFLLRHSTHAPEVVLQLGVDEKRMQSVDDVQPPQVWLASQTGAVADGQSVDPRHATQTPDAVSQTGVAGWLAHSLFVVQCDGAVSAPLMSGHEHASEPARSPPAMSLFAHDAHG